MKMFLKRFGIIFVILGVITLAYSEFSKLESNGMLILSSGLIVGGLIVYIIFNNIID